MINFHKDLQGICQNKKKKKSQSLKNKSQIRKMVTTKNFRSWFMNRDLGELDEQRRLKKHMLRLTRNLSSRIYCKNNSVEKSELILLPACSKHMYTSA